jgi:hypothetical protein
MDNKSLIEEAIKKNWVFYGKDEEDKTILFVVRCPNCKRENWSGAVAIGQCAWCGWTEQSNNVEYGRKPKKIIGKVVYPQLKE